MASADAKGFGAALRRAREAAGQGVRELAEVTRIQARYIEALEAEDWHSVPKGVIGRGFVRVLARELGTPPGELLQLYRGARGDDDAEPETRSLPEVDWKVDVGGGHRRRPLLIGGGVALALVVALWRWAPVGCDRRQAEPPPEEASDAGQVLTPPSDGADSSAPTPPTRQTTASAPLEAAPRQTPPASAVPAAAPVPGVPAVPAPAATGETRLEIEARARVWVRVQPAGGPAQERVLKAGERASFPGTGPFDLKVSDGGAVRLFWDGRPLGPAGPASQVASLTVPGTSAP